jgi:hypothetical protein
MQRGAFRHPARPRGRKRNQGRLDVRLHASIKTLSGSRAAILENISKSGAKLCVQVAVTKGSQVVVEWHGYEAFGTVAWASPTHCGVIFSSPVTEAVLRATVDINEKLALPDDDADRIAAREWASGSARFGFD